MTIWSVGGIYTGSVYAVAGSLCRIQAHRVAAQRHLPLSRGDALIKANTDGRFLGVLGEPGVNVTTLNQDLDR
jgi:K+-transporting ATPase ATPase C chain